ncbi:hypothetical protein EG328_006183 [Venturia inaequalis]|uniref:Uncharacterized protein n=1 Tax=Venturia inaequalis TaxID=5025 RepID=A0A8H3UH82_VENIN|nr:hypothetical protein EG328_006183 [Venturia inaequalis]KAE9988356.1 hypothetical protein EG327_003385 [Venturia inaequalis]
MLSFKSILFVLSAIFHTIYAVEVAPNSPCSQSCIDFPNGNISDTAASHTTEKDVVCNDWEYTGENSTTVGQKFKACNNCEQYSPAIDSSGGENDLYWFLFNLKSTVVWCVFGVYGSTTSSQPTRAYNACNSACQPIAPALLDKLQVTNQDLQYNYCNASNNAFNSGVDACAKCLSTVSNVQMIGNFISALKTACVQRPALGKTLSLGANIFSLPGTSTSSTTILSSVSTSVATSVSTSIPSSTVTPETTPSSASTLPLISPPERIQTGTIAGIVTGAVSGIILVTLVVVLCCRRRKSNEEPIRDYDEVSEKTVSIQEMIGDYEQGKQVTAVMPKYELDGRGPYRQTVLVRHELS